MYLLYHEVTHACYNIPMTINNFNITNTHTLLLSALLSVALIITVSAPAFAAPHTVTYRGTRVTTAVPGKSFNLNLQVKNTSNDNYPRVQITFHVPDGLQHSSVAPADAIIQDDTITWHNVPMNADQTFNPSFNFIVDAGTALNTKLNLWAEVTGDGLESTSTNFSITTRPASATAVSSLTSSNIKSMFQSVYGRTPTASELAYWLGRRADKPQRVPLLGAIAYHHALNIRH